MMETELRPHPCKECSERNNCPYARYKENCPKIREYEYGLRFTGRAASLPANHPCLRCHIKCTFRDDIDECPLVKIWSYSRQHLRRPNLPTNHPCNRCVMECDYVSIDDCPLVAAYNRRRR